MHIYFFYFQVRLPNSQVKKGNVPVRTKLEQAVALVCSDSSLRTGEIEIIQVLPLIITNDYDDDDGDGEEEEKEEEEENGDDDNDHD